MKTKDFAYGGGKITKCHSAVENTKPPLSPVNHSKSTAKMHINSPLK
jgi:hypothetical protein